MANPTQQEIDDAGLTPEELEALSYDEDEDEGSEGEEGQDAGDEGESSEADDEGTDDSVDEQNAFTRETEDEDDDDGQTEEAIQAEESKSAPAAASAEPVEEAVTNYEDEFKHLNITEYVGIETRMPEQAEFDAIEKGLKELNEKFNDGEIEHADYQDQRDKLRDKNFELKQEQREAESELKRREAASKQVYIMKCRDLIKKNPIFDQNDAAFDALNAEVIRIGNANRSMSDAEVLTRAKQKVLQYFPDHKSYVNKPDGKEKAAPVQAASKPKFEKQPVKLPPNLRTAPSAEINDTRDSQHAYLDRLAETNGEKFEAELAKMSKAQQDRYMQSN